MKSFPLNCKGAVQNKFVTVWNKNLQDNHINPILRTNKVFEIDIYYWAKPMSCEQTPISTGYS